MEENSFSLVIPCHNEEKVLQKNVTKILKELNNFESQWEVIIVEDGCTDSTPEIADKISRKNDRVTHLHFEEKLGKGKAISEAFQFSESSKLLFMDADLATDLNHISDLVEQLENQDIVIGSRYKRESSSEREIKREILSKVYNITARTIFRTEIKDHQCGFKGFGREVFEEINEDVESEHWFWDTEMIIKAQKKNFKVKEIPVEWEEKRDSGVNLTETIIHFSKKLFQHKIG